MSGAHRARFAPRRGQRDARRAATAAAGEMRGSGPERCRRHISRSVLSPRPPPTAGLGCCVHAPHKIFGLFVRQGKGNRQEVHTLYLSVNSDNTRAKKLYTKLGWSHACKRAPQMSLLLKALPTGLALDVDVTQLRQQLKSLSIITAAATVPSLQTHSCSFSQPILLMKLASCASAPTAQAARLCTCGMGHTSEDSTCRVSSCPRCGSPKPPLPPPSLLRRRGCSWSVPHGLRSKL